MVAIRVTQRSWQMSSRLLSLLPQTLQAELTSLMCCCCCCSSSSSSNQITGWAVGCHVQLQLMRMQQQQAQQRQTQMTKQQMSCCSRLTVLVCSTCS
jgi:membrane protein YqaA with SNARE-associated domain